MTTFECTIFFAFLAVATTGILAAPSGTILEGPSSRSTIVGPDGSVIDSVSPGGQIIRDEGLGYVARSAPFVAAAPALTYSAPGLAYSALPLTYSGYSTPTILRSSPLAYSAPLLTAPRATGWTERTFADNVIAGPSGSIVTGRRYADPWLAPASRIFL